MKITTNFVIQGLNKAERMADSLRHLANVVEDFLVAGQEAKTFPSDGNSGLQLLIHKQTAEDFDQGTRILIRKSSKDCVDL